VLSSTCIKGIGRNGIFAAEQSKPRGRHNHLIAATLIADRAVAGMSVQLTGCVDFKFDRAAVAGSIMSF
jgi:hypothetical protein